MELLILNLLYEKHIYSFVLAYYFGIERTG